MNALIRNGSAYVIGSGIGLLFVVLLFGLGPAHFRPQAEAAPTPPFPYEPRHAHWIIRAGASTYEAFQVLYTPDGRVMVWTDDGFAIMHGSVSIEYRP